MEKAESEGGALPGKRADFSARFAGGWTRVEPPPPREDLGPFLFPSPPLPPRLAELKRWWRAHPLPDTFPRDPARQARDFLRQARTMADYEDDFPDVAPFHRYWPTYRDMDDAQLRTYFSFRAKVRRGETPRVPLSYLFVFAYELISLVGVSSPAEALDLLTKLERLAAASRPAAEHFARWRRDFVVFHDLADAAETVFAEENARDRDLALLARAADAADDALFEAVARLGGFRAERSPGVRAAGAAFQTLVCRVVRALAARPAFFFSSVLHLHERVDDWRLFAGAIFFERAPQPDHVFAVNPVRRFSFERGACFSRRWLDRDFPAGRARALGDLLRECDRRLRLSRHLPGRLKERTLPPGAAQAIDRALADLLPADGGETDSSRKIEIDFANLSRIRRDAAATCEALLSEEEKAEAAAETAKPAPSASPPPPAPPPETSSGPVPPAPLRGFLASVLDGSWAAFARAAGKPAEVLADRLNDWALEATGDLLLEDGGNGPRVIEDYIDLARRLADG